MKGIMDFNNKMESNDKDRSEVRFNLHDSQIQADPTRSASLIVPLATGLDDLDKWVRLALDRSLMDLVIIH